MQKQTQEMKLIQAANRLTGFDKPTVWTIMTPLAIKTKSVNLGQGFPSWSPPKFYLDFLSQSVNNSNHQYTRAFGSVPYVESIARYQKRFQNLNPETEILTVNGGVEGLYSSIMGLVNPGDEVIQFDPSYDCYRPQIQMAGATCIGIAMKPKQSQSKEQLKKRAYIGQNGLQQFKAGQQDDWVLDFQKFQKSLSSKTKMVILNNPHNPTGKVFNSDEINRIASILKKYPNVVVLEDNVYEGMTFDDTFEKPLPKVAFVEGMYNRTLSIYSAGKIFAATGVRSGWVIGPAHLIKSVRSVHQYNVFCAYNVIENAIAKSLDVISSPTNTYFSDYAMTLTKNRNLLLNQLIQSKFDWDLWVPKGGYFVIADISRCQINPKYMKDEDGKPLTRDYAFSIQLAHEEGVVAIPCSPFYSLEDANMGEKYLRFAFCKTEDLILEAGKRMKLKPNI